MESNLVDVIDVEARVVSDQVVSEGQPGAATEATPVLPLEQALVPAFEAKNEIAKADVAIVAANNLIKEIEAAKVDEVDTTTKEGEELLRSLLRRCVKQRTETKAAYETWNRPLLDAQKGLREVVKQVETIVQPHEVKLETVVKKIDEAREAERQRKIEVERQRIAALRDKIASITGFPVVAVKLSSAEIDTEIRTLQDMLITDAEDSFGEFSDEAEAVRGSVISQLLEMSASKRAQEEEAARLNEERARQLEEQRKVEIERGLRVKISEMQRLAFSGIGKTVVQIKVVLDELKALEPIELEFGDLAKEATATWSSAKAGLENLLETTKRIEKQEAEQKRIAAEQEAERRRLAEEERRQQESARTATPMPTPEPTQEQSMQTFEKPQSEPWREELSTVFSSLAVADGEVEVEPPVIDAELYDSTPLSPIEQADVEPELTMSMFLTQADYHEARAFYIARKNFDRDGAVGVVDDILDTIEMSDYPYEGAGTLAVVSLLLHPEVQAALRERQALLIASENTKVQA